MQPAKLILAGAGFGGFRGVHDLNLKLAICDNLGFIELGIKHERGQNAVCAGYEICAMENREFRLLTRVVLAVRRRRSLMDDEPVLLMFIHIQSYPHHK